MHLVCVRLLAYPFCGVRVLKLVPGIEPRSQAWRQHFHGTDYFSVFHFMLAILSIEAETSTALLGAAGVANHLKREVVFPQKPFTKLMLKKAFPHFNYHP